MGASKKTIFESIEVTLYIFLNIKLFNSFKHRVFGLFYLVLLEIADVQAQREMKKEALPQKTEIGPEVRNRNWQPEHLPECLVHHFNFSCYLNMN